MAVLYWVLYHVYQRYLLRGGITLQPPLWPSILLQIIFLLLTALFAAAELSIPRTG